TRPTPSPAPAPTVSTSQQAQSTENPPNEPPGETTPPENPPKNPPPPADPPKEDGPTAPTPPPPTNPAPTPPPGGDGPGTPSCFGLTTPSAINGVAPWDSPQHYEVPSNMSFTVRNNAPYECTFVVEFWRMPVPYKEFGWENQTILKQFSGKLAPGATSQNFT